MPTLTPGSEIAPTTARKAMLGGSTKLMLIRMEQGLGKTSIPPTIPYFVSEIAGNSDLKHVQGRITDLKEDRDSIFRVKAELDVLIPTVEKSALKPELKNSLLLRAKDLLGTLEQAADMDARFSIMEEELAALEAQRLKTKQEHYKAIETAANPREKAAELSQIDKMSQSTIEGHKEKVTQAVKLFQHLLRKIGAEYTYLRDSAPGSLKMKTFQDLSTPSTPSIDQQSAAKMPGARGG